jgi:hypothetical protein
LRLSPHRVVCNVVWVSCRFEHYIADILEVMWALGRGEIEPDGVRIVGDLDRVRAALDLLGAELPSSTVSKARYEWFFDELETTQSRLQLDMGIAEQLHQPLQIIRFAVDDLRDAIMDDDRESISDPQ